MCALESHRSCDGGRFATLLIFKVDGRHSREFVKARPFWLFACYQFDSFERPVPQRQPVPNLEASNRPTHRM